MTPTRYLSMVLWLALLSFPASAEGGQPDPEELQRLRSALMREVRIKDADGVTHRGLLTAMDSGDLVVSTAGGEVRVPIASARRIARRGDSVKEGALFGLAYGLLAMRYAGQGAETSGDAVIVSVMAPVMCTLIGAGLDALVNGWTTVYRERRD